MNKSFGSTISEIKKIGLKITDKSNTVSSNDNFFGLSESLLLTQKFINKIFKNHNFDAVIILGDRVEKLPIINNALIYRKLIFHLHGGEITYGALDDQVRHMITKSAHLHFPICKEYKKNILDMAEERFRILNSGSLAIENLKKFINNNEKKELVLLTFHPETLKGKFNWIKNFNIITKTLNKFNFKVVITAPGHEINTKKYINYIHKFVRTNKNFEFIPSLGYRNYFKILNKTLFVIGNSSSGIIEVPYFRIPTVNIGDRQKGRFFHQSIVSTNCREKNIKNSIIKVVSKKFQKKILKMKLYFGKGDASDKILKFILDNIKNQDKLINKRFNHYKKF
jgi:GDP/UDP-N,N'-diacetylbacillosamine 2-epimerase (hydrolysing)